MDATSLPPPTPEDQATERLVAAVESAIDAIQNHLANLADDGQEAKWSLSDLVRLLQLRNQLQEQRPRRIFACWVDDPSLIGIQEQQQREPAVTAAVTRMTRPQK